MTARIPLQVLCCSLSLFAACQHPQPWRADGSLVKEIKFLPVSNNVLKHKHEERGFVEVPLDYNDWRSKKINIFYRLIPCKNCKGPRDSSKPILVVINGGPGNASSSYRPYNFDYKSKKPQRDQLGDFLAEFRVLILDQRGTPGYSAPLDLNDEKIRPELILEYFDANEHARDHARVIETVLRKEKNGKFYLLGQSYGGLILAEYLALPEAPPAEGYIFSSASLPRPNPIEYYLGRRKGQFKLNQELAKKVPDIEKRIRKLRAHLKANGINPDYYHRLWFKLGRGEPGQWEPKLVAEIEKIQKMKKLELEEYYSGLEDGMDLLNYILSASCFTPGYTDRNLVATLKERVPFKSWMIDELWSWSYLGNQKGTWKEKLLDKIDSKPPPAPNWPTDKRLRNQIAKNKVLFVIGQGDAFGSSKIKRERIKKLEVRGHTQVLTLPGGHKAAFYPKGVKALKSWMSR